MQVTIDSKFLYPALHALGNKIQQGREGLAWDIENEPEWYERDRDLLNGRIRAYNEISSALGTENIYHQEEVQ